MTTDLYTVHEEESVEFVACLMDWQRLRHVLVEDTQHRLVGLVSHRSVLRYLAEYGPSQTKEEGVPVKEIMVSDPVTVTPETPIVEGVKLMRDRQIGTLPVVRDEQLVGVITERDFIQIAGQLLDESLAEDEADADPPPAKQPEERELEPDELPGPLSDGDDEWRPQPGN